MKKCIVTTTISSPTLSTKEWAKRKDYDLIIVGDLKTPHDEYRELEVQNSNFKYLSPDDQILLSKNLSDAIGWNKIQRRNMGFLYAYANKYDIIGTFDDDNLILDSWSGDTSVGKEIEVDVYENIDHNAFDPFSVLKLPFHHRGYPLEYCKNKNNIQKTDTKKIKVLVEAPIPYGDSDVDAITRIMIDNNIGPYIGNHYSSNQIMPFNSQCTFIHRDILKYYFMLTDVGRHDDILGSYLLQKRMKENGYMHSFIVFSASIAIQNRNEHNLFKDLQQEVFGYCNSGAYINSHWKSVLPKSTLETYLTYEMEMKKYD